MYLSEVLDFIEAAQSATLGIATLAGNPQITSNEWRTSWIYNTALLEGIGDALLELQAPASAIELKTAIRVMATAMKNAGYNLRIGVVNFDADSLALGTQQMGEITDSTTRVIQETTALCVPRR